MSDRDVYAEFKDKRDRALEGGPEKYRQRQLEAGKQLVRDRIAALADGGTILTEDGLLARLDEDLPGDAVVTCTVEIHGRPTCIIANDFTVKAGTWGRLGFRKITRMQEVALELGAPLVYLIDSAGARIDEQFDSYAGRIAWGNIFYNQIQVSGRIPQACIMFGPSPAGSAYVPALCDLTIMIDGLSTAYIGSPRMAKMATGEDVTLEEMGGARMHCSVSGLGDVLVADEAEALASLRRYLAYFPTNWHEHPPPAAAVPPVVGRSIREIVPPRENVAFEMKDLIGALVDEGSFYEVKALFAKELVTGLARLGGEVVGIVANNSKFKAGVLFPDSSDKAARFVWLCNAFNIPLLFLQDISGFMVGSAVEKAGIIRHGAKMLFAVAEARVPRIAVMVRKAYGGGYLAMSGSPMAPAAVLALPTAKPALMGSSAAVNAIHFNRIMEIEDEHERISFINEKRAEYEADIEVLSVASENSIEAVVDPEDLRAELIYRFALYRRRPAAPHERRNGVYPV